MKLILLHLRFRLQELRRQPAYVVMSLVLPILVFAFFGVPNAKTPEAAQMLMASFSCFAMISVVLNQLALQVSFEKSGPWNIYLHTLPVHASQIFIARIIAQIVFAMFSVAAVVLVAHLTVDVNLPRERWWSFCLSVYLGGISFASLGVLLGILFHSHSIISAANLFYLPLTFAGGLWLPPNALPKVVQDISEYLPTRMYGEVVWAAVLDTELKIKYVWGLIIYMLGFIILAFILYRRDEGRRFG